MVHCHPLPRLPHYPCSLCTLLSCFSFKPSPSMQCVCVRACVYMMSLLIAQGFWVWVKLVYILLLSVLPASVVASSSFSLVIFSLSLLCPPSLPLVAFLYSNQELLSVEKVTRTFMGRVLGQALQTVPECVFVLALVIFGMSSSLSRCQLILKGRRAAARFGHMHRMQAQVGNVSFLYEMNQHMAPDP